MSSLHHKVVFITGASSGIGEACAKILAKDGARLILTARRQDRLKALTESLQETYGTECLTRTLDVRDKSAVQDCIDKLPSNWQAIDILINNAGLAMGFEPLQSGLLENWETMIDTNIKGFLYVSRAILPGMVKRNSGHVVNIGSIAGQDCYPNGNVYAATKHSVRALTKSMRLDLFKTKLRVTEIAPGAVETEFSIVRFEDEKKAQDFYKDFTPLIAQDIADAVHYCLTRPPHVDIAEMTIMPTDQAACMMINREKS